MVFVSNFLLQFLPTVGLTIVFGLVVWALKRMIFHLAGAHARTVCMVTGFIGTPVHELGHAFFCVIFGHKITEIKLFQPNNTDGVLGYVNHSFHKKNIYHQIGNFFIGFGPILFGSGVLALLMFLSVPDLFYGLGDVSQTVERLKFDFSLSETRKIVGVLWGTVQDFFHPSSFVNPLWWVFVVPACSIALHMSLSIADVKGSLVGFGVVTAVWFIIDIILYFANEKALRAVTDFSVRAGGFLLAFYMISVSLSIFLIIFCCFPKLIMKLKK